MDYKCTKCESEDIKLVSIIYDQGFSDLNGRTASGSVSTGGIGASSGTISGASQTKLSKKASPPQKLSYIWTIVFWFFSALILMWVLGWVGIDVSGQDLKGKIYEYSSFIVLALLLFGVIHNNWKVYPNLKKKWEHSFMCLRCGEVIVDPAIRN